MSHHSFQGAWTSHSRREATVPYHMEKGNHFRITFRHQTQFYHPLQRLVTAFLPIHLRFWPLLEHQLNCVPLLGVTWKQTLITQDMSSVTHRRGSTQVMLEAVSQWVYWSSLQASLTQRQLYHRKVHPTMISKAPWWSSLYNMQSVPLKGVSVAHCFYKLEEQLCLATWWAL